MNLNDWLAPLLDVRSWLQINAVASVVSAVCLLWMLVRDFDVAGKTLFSRTGTTLLRMAIWGIMITALSNAASVTSGAAALPVNVIQNTMIAMVMVWVVVSHERFARNDDLKKLFLQKMQALAERWRRIFAAVLFTSGIALASLLASPSTSDAQPLMACMKRDVLLKTLGDKYKEAPAGYGLVGGTSMTELYVSEKGTFTLVQSYPNGVSCIIAAGDNWETTPLSVKGTKS